MSGYKIHASLLSPRRRRTWIAAAALLTVSLAAALPAAGQTPDVVRIGYQRSSTLITLLKTNGEWRKALAPLGVR